MANNENLTPIRNTEEAKEKGRKGGINSGISKRKRKATDEILTRILTNKIQEGKAKSELKKLGYEDEELTNDLLMNLAIIKQAMKGNVEAYKTIQKLVGEYDKVQETEQPKLEIKIVNNEELASVMYEEE